MDHQNQTKIADVVHSASAAAEAAEADVTQQEHARSGLVDPRVPIGRASSDVLTLGEMHIEIAAAISHLRNAYQLAREVTTISVPSAGTTSQHQGC